MAQQYAGVYGQSALAGHMKAWALKHTITATMFTL